MWTKHQWTVLHFWRCLYSQSTFIYSRLSVSRTPFISNFSLSQVIFSVPRHLHWFQSIFFSFKTESPYLELLSFSNETCNTKHIFLSLSGTFLLHNKFELINLKFKINVWGSLYWKNVVFKERTSEKPKCHQYKENCQIILCFKTEKEMTNKEAFERFEVMKNTTFTWIKIKRNFWLYYKKLHHGAQKRHLVVIV